VLRDRQGARPTPAGNLFAPIARDILRRMEEGKQAIEDLQGLHRGELAIGAVDAASLYLLPEVLRRFRRDYPRIRLSVRVAGSRSLLAGLQRRELDLVFVLGVEGPRDFDARLVGEDPMLAVSPADESPVRHAERSWISYPRGSVTRELLDAAFARAGLPFNVSMEIDRPEVILQLVSAGLGSAALPSRLVDSWARRGSVKRLRIPGLRIARPIWLVHREAGRLSPAARGFVAQL